MYKLMLVDDEYMILKGLQQILPWEDLGFEIVNTVRNASQALNYLAENTIDLLITDITMPDKTGIEMVELAYDRGYKFSTIVLTGYQEFEYAKKSLQLGVKNYLLKPVDRSELLATVKKIKDELDSSNRQKEKEKLYMENHLSRWLHDELNDDEFDELKSSYKLDCNLPYTAVQFRGKVDKLEEIIDYLASKNEKLLVTSKIISKNKVIWIYQGSREELNVKLKILEEQVYNYEELLVGETVAEWEDLYESYEKIKQFTALKRFYPELLPQESDWDLEIESGDNLSFLSFNKALMIGDNKTIKEELAAIFNHMSSGYYDPDDVKYIAFFLFADIARKYPQATEKIYDQVIHKIRESHTITELSSILEEILQSVKNHKEEKPFSQVVQNIVDIVKVDYKEDLNLKAVADEMHLNVVYLGQLFKKETHVSFSQYLNQIRIRKAQELLLDSQDTINEISEATGYNNTNYFSKMFKKLNGITPKEFRDKYHGDYSILADIREV